MVDAALKTSGEARYTDDLFVPGMLIGKILHSHLPHARIRRIQVERALSLPGVRAVVVGADAPVPYGILPIGKDECALQPDKVRYIGDNVACVAAETEAIAEAALRLIEVEYDPLPFVLDAERAMEAPPEAWLHENRPRNIEKEYHHVFGDPEAAMARADLVVSRRYVCPAVTHVAMEPHATLARFEPDGALTVWSSTQVPYYLQMTLARVLEMPMERIRVIKPMVGGGFGGKSEVCPLEVTAAIAARKAGAPVKITCTREEVFYTHRGRPTQIIELTTGANRDGRIVAVAAKVIQDGGAYCGYGPVTLLYSGALLGALYDIPNVRWDGYRVLTNKPACGAMRGHGTVNTRFAFECELDEVAERLSLDPAEIRRRNLLRPPHVTVNGLRVLSYGLPECIERVVAASEWRRKRAEGERFRTPGPRRRGLGLACSHYVSGAANPINRSEQPHSTVRLEATPAGEVTILTGTAEIGQGSDTMQAQIVAETLGLPLDRVRVIAADSARTPVDLGSYSSRVTFMAGNAALRAAEALGGRIASAVAAAWNCAPRDVRFADGRVRVAASAPEHRPAAAGDPSLSFADAVALALAHEREQTGAESDGRELLTATGTYAPPTAARGGSFKGAGVGPSPAYSYSAQVAEVSVDEETGEVTVHKVWAAHDCGRALNPVTVEGQVIGSVWMGLGQALSEEMVYAASGQLVNPSMLEYRVPSTLESPEIEAFIVESIDPEGPFGAKEAGEGSLAAAIPAVANAIYDAVGVRLYEPPFTPDRVLRGLRALRSAAAPRQRTDALEGSAGGAA
jgi:4-hydroxybenzoyl-CoA reductase subunit alpha